MASPKRAPLVAALFVLALGLAGCGLGRDQSGDNGAVRNPIVAATVNGRPIYVEDVRAHAVARGILQEGQDLDANSNAFYFALEELIQVRLFAMEAEARGLDRQPDVARQLENAREQVLANAIYEEIDERATNPQAIARLYNENMQRLGQGQEVHLRHIQFDTREAADAAKRRLDHGERFEALAFELSTDRDSAADGGDMDWGAVSDLNAGFRQAIEHANVGDLVGPVEINGKWELIRVDDRRERGAQSLETLRPRIVDWLRFQEITQLEERLERNARIERLREPEQGMAPTPQTPAPPDATQSPSPPSATHAAPDVTAPPGQNPPPFPFPVGPGSATGPAQQTQAPPPAHVTAPVVAPPRRGNGGQASTATTTSAGPSQ
ncbi:MAG: peptidylprolyl isomerase [Proteobacteria bacterium]|nr:peptidylprolyl isomerase [Pseudomonadota bacterium]